MKINDYDYCLPHHLIAQVPVQPRDHSRLLIVDRDNNSFYEEKFYNIYNYFFEGDLLVLNDTKVIPCRIYAKKNTGGNVEILLLKEIKKRLWECFIKSNKKICIGDEFTIENSIKCFVEYRNENFCYLRFDRDFSYELLEKIGNMPVPPYIKRKNSDKVLLELDSKCYQTVYADCSGAVAAPTAGLHFTDELLNKIQNKGVSINKITLHTGPGTFLPIKATNVENHRMMEEYCKVDKDVMAEIIKTKKNKKKVIAVGTTTVRSVETAFLNGNSGYEGFTELFIYPVFKFKGVDALVTNFHLPKSTLLLLVSAFAGKELIRKAYDYAVNKEFRFYSYGDGMLIL